MPGKQPQGIDLQRARDGERHVERERMPPLATLDAADRTETDAGVFFERGLGQVAQLANEPDPSGHHAAPRVQAGVFLQVLAEGEIRDLEGHTLSHLVSTVCTPGNWKAIKKVRRNMPIGERLGWFFIALFLALGVTLAVLGRTAHAESSTLTDRLVTAQTLFQSKTEASVDARALAETIVGLTKGNRDWSALVLTVAVHEGGLSQRIANGECHARECDSGRAWGLFQIHQNAWNARIWGSTDLLVQTAEGIRTLRRAFYTCNGPGKLRLDWARVTLSAYAGQGCSGAWPGLDQRMLTFERVKRRL
jgi:hypothetical protein